MKKKRDYKVGYGKPPATSRFKKGKSGNPKGRPKGSRNFASDLKVVLNTKVRVTEDGEQKTVTSQLAIMMQLRAQALNGNPKAMDKIITLAKELGVEEAARGAEHKLTTYDENILDRFAADLLEEAKRNSKGEEASDEQD